MNIKKVILTLTILIAGFASTVQAKTETYRLDPAHGQVGFRVKHLVISNVTGEFLKYEGVFEVDESKNAMMSGLVTIDASSIFTKHKKRDKHLKSADFLDVEKFPQITFKYKRIASKTDSKFTVLGDLSLHGVTKEVLLDMEVLGKIKDPWGNFRVGFTGTTRIDRRDFGITWSKVMDNGGLIVGDIVNVNIEGEAILDKPKTKKSLEK